MRNLGRNLNIKSDKSAYTIAVAIALLLASVLLVTYFVTLQPVQNGYTTIYLLDSQKKAVDYPEFLVAGVNSTFSVYVDVENHNGAEINAQVLVKVVSGTNPTFPVDANPTLTFNGTVKDGATWENVATVSLNEPGNYSVVYELWTSNQNAVAQFTGNQCVLNVRVVAENATSTIP